LRAYIPGYIWDSDRSFILNSYVDIMPTWVASKLNISSFTILSLPLWID